MFDPTKDLIFYPESQFHDVRKNFVGASEVAGILNIGGDISKYNTPLSVFMAKMGLDEKPDSDAYHLRRGRNLEQYVINEYKHRTGAKLWDCKVTTPKESLISYIQHPDYEFAAFHPDSIVVEYDEDPKLPNLYYGTKGFEAKTSSIFSDWGFEGTDDIPYQYIIQVQWGMFCSGLPEFDLGVEIGLRDYRIYNIKRNDELINAMYEKVDEFWHKHVLAKEAPPATGTEVDKKILDAMFLESQGTISPNEKIINAARNLKLIKEQLKLVEKSKIAEENIIKDEMKDNSICISDDFKISWKHLNYKDAPDYEAIAKYLSNEYEEDIDKLGKKYLKPKKSTRRFDFKPVVVK